MNELLKFERVGLQCYKTQRPTFLKLKFVVNNEFF